MFLLAKIQPQLSPAQDHALKKSLYDLVRLNARGRNGYTLLHLACTRDNTTLSRYPVCSFPSVEVILLLLEVGSDPVSVDQVWYTRIHWNQFQETINNHFCIIVNGWTVGREHAAAHLGPDATLPSTGCPCTARTRRPSWSSKSSWSLFCPASTTWSSHSWARQPSALYNAQVSLCASSSETPSPF